MTRRTIAVWLVIVSSILSFSVVTLTASSGKTIPFDEVNHRLETVLQELSRTAQARPLALSQLAQDRGIALAEGNSITVVIEPVSGNTSRIDRAAVRALGGTIEATSKSLMRVRVPIDRLEAMADQVNGIAFIRLPYQPRPLVVTSQGVALTGASDFHTAGYYGQGTKVAIIDLGFIGLTTAQAAGELDNVVYTHDYTGGGLETYTEHGTGVAEVVADMAPQASLYLLMIGDSVDLQNATDYCITNGIDIINHSVGWYNSNYYDGTGIVANIANNARDNGILWVNAAGNEASDGHWQGSFLDVDGDNWHEFVSGDERNSFYLVSGDTITILMTWDDWIYSDQNYDLYLYNPVGVQVRSSLNWQLGAQHPTEKIVYTATSSGRHSFAIYRCNAPLNPEIEVFLWNETGPALGLEYHIYESTIITPANSAKVLTAGAISYWNWTTGPQESFSSQGPSNASKYAVSLTKPDVMGPDGTSSYTYGSFYGTSAASPHIAGAAALLLSEDPTRTADQLQTKIEGDAVDMGSSGKDNIYGSGRLRLLHLSGNFQIEANTVSLNHEWQTVNLSKAFTNPVVVAKPLSYNDHDPAVVRIRNVTASSFETRIEEWDYKDGWHTLEIVGYLIMERGHWTLPDGTEVEAGSTTTAATGSLIDVSFTSGFSITPVVVTAVTTFNGSDTVATRNRNITTSRFQTGMQEQEANAQSHANETISYIAWEPGSGTADGKTYEVGRTGDTITHAFYTVNFGFGRSVSIQVDEEASANSETAHTTEDVGYIAFDTSPLILIADMQTRDGGDTANLRYQESEAPTFQIEANTVSLNHEWQTVNLSKAFTNPVVVAKPLSYNDHDPAVIRIRNVTASSFETRIEEWDYKDGWHTLEIVGYLIMERGHWTLPDGTEVEAGSTTTAATGSLIDVSFTSGFSITPVVVTAVTTFNGSDTVTTRNRNITTSGFQTGMQEQEANAQSHANETISYIAWEPGSGTADGKTYEVGRTGDTVRDAFYTVNFGFGRSVSIQVDEEASANSETAHTTEDVGYIAFDTSPLILIADMQTRDGGDTANLRYQESEAPTFQIEANTVSLNHEWQTVNLSKAFTNPVVVAKPLSYNDHDPAVIRIRNVTASSFETRIEEWDYKDGWHTLEIVGYLIMERGHWTLPDGTEVEAGSTTTAATGSLIDVSFTSGFSITPVVVTAVTTFNESDAVTTRNRNITTSRFQTGMQEQEANAQSHANETISYIAWEPGSGTADGKTYEVGRTGDTVRDAFYTVNFGFGRSVSIQVDEEASANSETAHTTEDVGYIAFDTSPLILIADMQTRDGGDTANLRYQESESSTAQGMDYWQGLSFVEQVLSMPNPVRRGETARFVVEGQGIESVQVEIYDLSGKRVFTSDWYPGDTMEWHTVDDKGRRLANGAYLYLVKAKGPNGEEIVSKVGTIFVLY